MTDNLIPDFDFKKNRENLHGFIYSDPETVVEEIKKRRLHANKREGEKILGFIHRDVTPNLEINRCISICDVLDIEPFFLDNPNDILVYRSRYKYYLGRMTFFKGYGKKGGLKHEVIDIIDIPKSEGQISSSIPTIYNKKLIDFHKMIFSERYKNLSENISDITKLAKSRNAIDVYKKIFSMCIIDGILIENFSKEEEEKEFNEEVIIPAFKEVWRDTGLKPLVTPFLPIDIENDDFWYYYSEDILEIIKNIS